MKFLSKFFISFILILAFIALHCYTTEIGNFNLKINENEISIGLYLIFAGVVFLIFLLSVVKSFFNVVTNIFKRNKKTTLAEYADKIAILIQLNGKEFFDNIKNLTFPKEFETIKKSLLIEKKSETVCNLPFTGIKLLDSKIIKAKLHELIKQQGFENSVRLAQKFINNFPQFVELAQDEILQIGIAAKQRNLNFSFDPRKYKYNLSVNFIKKYLFSIDCVELEKENSNESKLKLLEKIVKNHSEISDSYNALLNFIRENNIKTLNDAKVIDMIKSSFKIQPNRNLAYDLVNLNKPNQFEIAQEIANCATENNIEKLWFLLIVALKSGFYNKANEIIRKFYGKENIAQPLLYYYKTKPEEIANLKLDNL